MKIQNPSIHHSKVNGRTHTQTDRQTDKPKAICPSNFFKVGGIKKTCKDNLIHTCRWIIIDGCQIMGELLRNKKSYISSLFVYKYFQ